MVTNKEPIEFNWDNGNKNKNWIKHRVTDGECEEIFFDENKNIYKDKLHSAKEERFILLGKTNKERLLYAVYTIRKNTIRIISARDADRKEEKLYEKSA